MGEIFETLRRFICLAVTIDWEGLVWHVLTTEVVGFDIDDLRHIWEMGRVEVR